MSVCVLFRRRGMQTGLHAALYNGAKTTDISVVLRTDEIGFGDRQEN